MRIEQQTTVALSDFRVVLFRWTQWCTSM